MKGRPQWAAPSSQRTAGVFGWGGFSIDSNMPLPRLSGCSSPPDTTFRWVGAPSFLFPAATLRAAITIPGEEPLEVAIGCRRGVVSYEVARLGTFALNADRSLIEFLAPGPADPMLVEHTLVHSVLSVYAALKPVVCLHAAAVAKDGQAVLFAGPSGAGKSTAAWEMLRQGWRLLGDDAAVLRLEDGGWMVSPGALTIRMRDLNDPSAWIVRGKRESYAAHDTGGAALKKIVLLDKNPGAADRVPASTAYRSLVALQPGWQWTTPRRRRTLAELTWEMAKETQLHYQPRYAPNDL